MIVIEEEIVRIDEVIETPFVAFNPQKLHIEVACEASAHIVVLHTAPDTVSDITVTQAEHSRSRITVVQLSSSNVIYTTNLNGAGAESELSGVFIVNEKEHCELKLRTNHNKPDCRSNSYIKGVAGGDALGEFDGLVYVAADAQRTDARQQSRNILLSDRARILTRPRLEIYADDVKCTHGATVGQPDSDAIFYMRQRGLSEAQARMLQIEGFVGDIVCRCGIDELCEEIMQTAKSKMQNV